MSNQVIALRLDHVQQQVAARKEYQKLLDRAIAVVEALKGTLQPGEMELVRELQSIYTQMDILGQYVIYRAGLRDGARLWPRPLHNFRREKNTCNRC